MYESYVKKVISHYPSGMRIYRKIVASKAQDCTRVLHLGCGRDLGQMLNVFTPVTTVVGLDSDKNAIAEYPGEGHVGNAENMMFSDNEFDMVFSEMVLEHLENPAAVFEEVSRVLKPNGNFISVTPNFYSYKSLAAAVTPHWFHEFAVRILRRESPRQDCDVYPTVYKANTKRDIEKIAFASGLIIDQLLYADNGPTWFQRIPGLFEIGRLYHATLRWPPLKALRCNLVIVLKKPEPEPEQPRNLENISSF